MQDIIATSPTREPEPQYSDAPAPIKVEHLYWVENNEFALVHGTDLTALCGAWITPNGGSSSLVDLSEDVRPTDCALCVAVLAADREASGVTF